MKKKTSTLRWRIGILAALILMLATVLTGCASGNSGSKPTVGDVVLDSSYEGGLDATQLKAVATLLSNTYNAKDFQTPYMLLAASRGYDMTAEGFDDSAVSADDVKTDEDIIAAAKALIATANGKASDSNKIKETDYEKLDVADVKKLVELFQTSVDLSASSGVFDSIQRGIGYFLNWLTTYLGFGSYIVGICIFAVLVEILMVPFAIKQQKNSIKQANLRPKEMAIRKKYAGRNDQVTMQKLQKEIQEMYAKENFSPYSGCLPLLVQFPIIIILYNIIINPLVYVLGQSAGVSSALSLFYSAPKAAGGLGLGAISGKSTIELLSIGRDKYAGIANFGLFSNGDKVWESIQSIKALPNFNIGPFDFGLTPVFPPREPKYWILLLVPVLTFVVYFFSMKLTRKFSGQAPAAGATDRQTACSNTMMDIMMPAMSAIFTFMVPGIIGVYWMFRSVIGILKSFIMSKVMPLPTFTEADYKAAEKELAGKAPKKVQKSERAGTVRSLHHIDDEDFEDTREAALERKARMEEQTKKEQAEKAESAKKSPFGIPLLKKDRKAEKQEAEKDAKTDEKPAEAPAEVPAENAPTEAPAENTPTETAPTETKPEETTNSEDGQAK